MATLGKAVIEFSADTAKFVGDIGRTAAVFEKSMARMEAGVANLRNSLVAVASFGGIGSVIKSTIDAADQLNKLSQKIGVSVEKLSELKFAAELADVGMDDLTRGFKEFNKALVEANDSNSKAAGIFSALGVSPSGDPAADLHKVAEAFRQLTDGAVKSTIAGELFGKSGLSWIPLLNQGGEALTRAGEAGRKMGFIISGELAKQAEVFNDNLNTLSRVATAASVGITGHLIGGLATLTSRLVEGVEKGEGFKRFLKESTFLAVALGERLRSVIPFLNLVPPQFGEWVFRSLDSDRGIDFNKMMKEHGARWGQGGGPTAAPAPDPAALACVASGGKWINGKCVRTGAGARTGDDNLVGRQLAEDAEEWARIMSEAAHFSDLFRQREREGSYWENMGMTKEQHDQWIQSIDFIQDYEVKVGQLAAGFDGLGNAVDEVNRKTMDWGFTFDSAIEGLIDKSAKFSDVLRAIGQDLARMFIRQAVTAPLGKFAASVFGSIFGGARAFGGPVTAGEAYMVGERGPEMFVPAASGTIVPNGGMGGTYYINAPGADRAGLARLEAMIRDLNGSIEHRAVSATSNFLNRGGQR